MQAENQKSDARLTEGVAYFEEMLKVMPEDRTTLEFLAVAYLQMGQEAKAEGVVTTLARVLLKENDLKSAAALLERLESYSSPEAKAMAIKVRVATAERPELVPEKPKAAASAVVDDQAVIESEAALADQLGENELVDLVCALPPNSRRMLVSALSILSKEHPEACDKALMTLAERYSLVPIPLDAFEPDREMIKRLPEDVVRVRGVIPFAHLGEWVLVAFLSPHDKALRQFVSAAFGGKVQFYLAEPTYVEEALVKIYPELAEKNA